MARAGGEVTRTPCTVHGLEENGATRSCWQCAALRAHAVADAARDALARAGATPPAGESIADGIDQMRVTIEELERERDDARRELCKMVHLLPGAVESFAKWAEEWAGVRAYLCSDDEHLAPADVVLADLGHVVDRFDGDDIARGDTVHEGGGNG